METVPDDASVRVRCHELAPIVGDLTANLRQIRDGILVAAEDGIQLLVLPELATSGYNLAGHAEARNTAISADGEELKELAGLVPPSMIAVVGFCEFDGEKLFNSAAALSAERVLAVYRKTHLWNTEKRIFEAGDNVPPVLRTPFGGLGILVCYDLEFPEVPRALALAGADIIAAPVNWPLLARPQSEHAPEIIQTMAAARSSRIAIACCDRSGDERGVRWTRGTSIIDADGWIAAARISEQEGAALVDATVRTVRDRCLSPLNDVINDRRPQLYRSLTTVPDDAPHSALFVRSEPEQEEDEGEYGGR